MDTESSTANLTTGESNGGGEGNKPEPTARTTLIEMMEPSKLVLSAAKTSAAMMSVVAELHSLVKQNKADDLSTLLATNELFQKLDLHDDVLMGKDGTVLHMAVDNSSYECAKILIDKGGVDLITKPYSFRRYRDVLPLHLAVIKQKIPFIELLLGYPFPDPKTKEDMMYAKAYRRDGSYIDKMPWIGLHLAAGMGSIEVIECLLDAGADLWVPDPDNGNSVVHSLCRVAATETCCSCNTCVTTLHGMLESEKVMKWWKDKESQIKIEQDLCPDTLEEALLKFENADCMTPFMYASFLGSTSFATAILEVKGLYTFPQRVIGPSRYSEYEMSEIDTAVVTPVYQQPVSSKMQQEITVRPSALEAFVYCLGDTALKYGQIPAIRMAMENKWQTYKWWMLVWFVFHSTVMTCFTLSAQFREESWHHLAENDTHQYEPHSNGGVIFMESFVLFSAVVYLGFELYDIIALLNRRYWTIKGFEETERGSLPRHISVQFDVYRIDLMFFSLSVFTVLFLRLAESDLQDLAYLVGSLTGWTFMLFFLRAFENIGVFAVMLRRMVMYELFDFSAVFLILLMSFSTACFVIYKHTDDGHGHPEEVENIPATIFTLFLVVVGYADFSVAAGARFPWVMKLLFGSFVILMNILILNMLIAAMGNTYAELNDSRKTMWMKVRTKAVLTIERRLPRWARPDHNLATYDDKPGQWFLGEEQMGNWHHYTKRK